MNNDSRMDGCLTGTLVIVGLVGGLVALVAFGIMAAIGVLGPDNMSLLLAIGAAALGGWAVVSGVNWAVDLRHQAQTRALDLEKERRQLNLVRADYNGLLPVDMNVLTNPAVVERMMAAYVEHQAAKALPGSRTPTSMTYAPHMRYANDVQVTGNEQPKLPAIATPQSFYQLWTANALPNDKFLLGYDLHSGEAVHADWKRLYSALVGGASGSGKSTLIRSILAQSAMQGGRFLVLDPHYGAGDESLGYSLQPLRHLMIADVAANEQQMGDALAYVREIGQRRLSGQDKDHSPVVLVVDETTALLQRGNVAEPLAETLGMIAQETRKVGIYAFAIGQNFDGRIMDTTIRNSFVSMLGCRMRRDVGRTMAGFNEFGKHTEQLEIGQAVWLDPSGEMRTVAVPNCTQRDLELISGHIGHGGQNRALPVVGPTSTPTSIPTSTPTSTMPVFRVSEVGMEVGMEVDKLRAERVRTALRNGQNVSQIISDIWGVSGGRAYQQASSEFYEILSSIV